eukprot:6206363-Pleurochrysis_carterae.AAC.1
MAQPTRGLQLENVEAMMRPSRSLCATSPSNSPEATRARCIGVTVFSLDELTARVSLCTGSGEAVISFGQTGGGEQGVIEAELKGGERLAATQCRMARGAKE